jgi:thiol:disulfide interchange protein
MRILPIPQALFLGVTSFLSGLSLADQMHQEPVNWETDIVKVQEKAKQQGKPVLLLFTGTKWCGVCQMLEQNVLSKPEFAAYVKD